MKQLTLTRHAKSSWKDSDLADFDRPLNKRGKRDLPRMARRLAVEGDPPDRIVTSPAARALETAKALAAELGFAQASLVTEPRIYGASHAQLFDILRHQPESCSHLMLVGHSPGIADLSRALCGAPEGKFPTCGSVRMRLPVEGWWDVTEGTGGLVFFDYPKKGSGSAA